MRQASAERAANQRLREENHDDLMMGLAKRAGHAQWLEHEALRGALAAEQEARAAARGELTRLTTAIAQLAAVWRARAAAARSQSFDAMAAGFERQAAELEEATAP